jgi:hypothetical protein
VQRRRYTRIGLIALGENRAGAGRRAIGNDMGLFPSTDRAASGRSAHGDSRSPIAANEATAFVLGYEVRL